MIELVHSEEFALRHISGQLLVLKNNEDNTFSAELNVNELLARINMGGFSTQDAAEQWAWSCAEQEDNKLGE
jgi:hypothetical protein